MKRKSIAKNAVLNGFRNILNLIFPLITFPYISRVLSVKGLGRYNFAQTTISYFILIAGLGISSYAIREGAKYKNDRNKFNKFASEIIFCNIISTLVSYLILILCICYISKFKEYTILLIIFSIQIIFTTIGVEWIYSIFEEYEYITYRSILFKVLSIILMFVFVKDEKDINIYAAITVFSAVGSNILNLVNSKKYFNIISISAKDCIKHIIPILIIFASNIAIMIYVYSDTTMLGFMTSDYEVGIYSVAVKIYNIVKNFLSAILIVCIPRLSMFWGNNMKVELVRTTQKVFDMLTTLILPAVVGLFCVSKQIILVISDSSYISAVLPLKILCVALFFCLYGWFFSQCILMPANGEKIIFIATCISAVFNILLNLLLIPLWQESATSFTTCIAEFIMFFICGKYALKTVKINIFSKNLLSVVVGCVFIIISCHCSLLFLHYGVYVNLLISILLSTLVYGIVLLLFHNTIIIEISNRAIGLLVKCKNKFNSESEETNEK